MILKQLIHHHHFGLAIRSSNLMETHLIPQSELRIIIKTYLEHSYQNKVLIKNLISENSEKFNEMDTEIAVCNLTSIQKWEYTDRFDDSLNASKYNGSPSINKDITSDPFTLEIQYEYTQTQGASNVNIHWRIPIRT